MGTSGSGIAQDDTVAEVVGFVTDRLKTGDSIESATSQARSRFAELEGDEDEMPLLWLALAHVQTKYGTVDTDILSCIRSDIASERGLERWREDPRGLAKRKAALAKFLAQIGVAESKAIGIA